MAWFINFPSEEKFGLTNQIRRAAISIALNIAEGSDKKSDAEFKRFLRMAIGSCEEVITGFYIALDQKYVPEKDFDIIYEQANMLVAKLNALVKSLNK
ncbi:MAG: four helix bundle protein [Candidatus Levybacteria bacterium]|nr:four helix bundle protein [Candidatus Levybacteria bacterium]